MEPVQPIKPIKPVFMSLSSGLYPSFYLFCKLNSAFFTRWNPPQEGRLRRHSTGRVRIPQLNNPYEINYIIRPEIL